MPGLDFSPAAVRTRSPRALADLAQLARTVLAELAAEVHYRRRTLPVPLMPLGLGTLRQRTSRLTGRTDYWWAWAGTLQPAWLPLRPGGVDELPRCRDRAAVARLLDGAR